MTKDQRNEYGKLHADCGSLITLCATEKRVQTSEEQVSQTARYARMDVLKAENEAEQKQALYAFQNGEPFMGSSNGKSDAQRQVEQIESTSTADFSDEPQPMTEAQIRQFRKSANRFLRTGVTDQFTITTTGNSILVPTQVTSPEVIRRNMNAFRALIAATGYQPISTTGTENIELPVFEDTGVTGDTPAENATSATTADFSTTESVLLGAKLYSSKQRWFSNTLLNANGFDILAYITPVLQKSVDKTQESAYTTALVALNGSAGTVTCASNLSTGVIYSDLLTWEHTLNVAYRSDAGFIVSDSLYKSLRGLVDNNKRPIFDLDPSNVFQGRIHGKPVFVSD